MYSYNFGITIKLAHEILFVIFLSTYFDLAKKILSTFIKRKLINKYFKCL